MPRLPRFEPDCTILFDGEPVPARRGEPVAAALLAAGKRVVSRSAKYHRPRGAYCLAGSCGTCLVRADGLPNQRACRTPCADGLLVETQNALPSARHDVLGAIDRVYPRGLDHHHLMTFSLVANRAAVAVSRRLAGLGTLPDAAAAAALRLDGPVAEERFDALVVGAGPAGLGAAEALARGGRRVLLADAEPAPGGRLRCRYALAGDPPLAWASAVAERIRAGGGEVLLRAAVLALWTDGGSPLAAVEVDGPRRALRLVRAERLVVSTGGHVQPPAVPDGDRPGVHAGRGLAVLLAEHGVLPGGRVAVLGDGAEAVALSARLSEAGAEVATIPAERAARVLGGARVRALVLAGGERVPCDTIALASPPAPATELARELGARTRFDETLRAHALEVDGAGATGVPGLFAAGEVTGAMDAAAAAEAGRRAGEAALG
jgi:sarcosine oxidase subunit alpha